MVHLRMVKTRTSLVAQWLRLSASTAGGEWVQSLVRELRSHIWCGMAPLKEKEWLK